MPLLNRRLCLCHMERSSKRGSFKPLANFEVEYFLLGYDMFSSGHCDDETLTCSVLTDLCSNVPFSLCRDRKRKF